MFQPGQQIGPYTLTERLGEGGYGVVWLAEERTGLLKRSVALKLPKDLNPNLEDIRREAESWLQAGKHTNIVQVLNADIYVDQVAIASEYVPGGTLHDWLKRYGGKAPSTEAAVNMIVGILSGLEHLHKIQPRPLIHRDLKPGNVLLNGDIPLLTDFGISRVFSSTVMTRASGTPCYMPPEAFDDRFSPQTDIWAAGVMLYEMLTGNLPFPQKDLTPLIGAILGKDPDPLPFSVPQQIVAVTMKALQKDPAYRFSSAAEMRTALFSPNSVPVQSSTLQTIPSYLQKNTAPNATIVPQPANQLSYNIPKLQEAEMVMYETATRNKELQLPSNTLPIVKTNPPSFEPLPIISEKQDGFLEKIARNTFQFCLTLGASLPIWAVIEGITDKVPHTSVIWFGAAVLNSVIFARLAWHRYAWPDAALRKKFAIRFAALGFFAGFFIPVVIVILVVAIGSATAPKRTPNEQDQIER